jgi:hypothetical protein
MTHIHWSAQQQLAVIDAKLTAEFKEYAELANPKPLGLAATQELLKADEALVLILDVPHFGKLPEESLIWVVTKTESRWARSELGTGQLAERLRRLRSGLDNNADPKGSAGERAAAERSLVGVGGPAGVHNFLAFDLVVAQELYVSLFGHVADLIRGKHLLIVPSGPLTPLPFHVFVTEKPNEPIPDSVEGYRATAWLAKQNAITFMPSVGSLQALRQLPPSQAHEAFIAFGNPLLLGPSGVDKSAWAKQRCATCGHAHRPSQRDRPARRLAACDRSRRAARTRNSSRNCRRALCRCRCAWCACPAERDSVAGRAGH